MRQTNFLKSRVFNSVVGLAGLLALSVSATLLAEVHESMKIKFKTEDGLNETVNVENLAVGSSDVFFTESGKEAFITRNENGLAIEIQGRTVDVKLPEIESLHDGHMVWHELGDAEGMHHNMKVIKLDGSGDKVHVLTDDDFGELHELNDEHVWVDEEGNAKSIIVKKAFISDEEMSEEEIANMLAEMNVDVDIDGDVEFSGTQNHEVVIIKRKEVDSSKDD